MKIELVDHTLAQCTVLSLSTADWAKGLQHLKIHEETGVSADPSDLTVRQNGFVPLSCTLHRFPCHIQDQGQTMQLSTTKHRRTPSQLAGNPT